MSPRRSLRAARVLLRASALSTLQYRAEVLFGVIRALFEVAWAVVPLVVVFGQRPTIGGWRLDEALLVTAWFTAEKALLEGVITPSVVTTIEQIRRGTFDFHLLKPVDSQLLVSLGRVEIFSLAHLLSAAALGGIAAHRLHLTVGPGQIAAALLVTGAGCAILYALNMMVVSIAFHVGRIDNLAYLLDALFDAARWPSSVFRGAIRFVFTFVLPLGLMTTYPPLALLGRLSPMSIGVALAIAVAALVLSRLVWLRAVRAYRSAGG
jgi:ABC-2 type transport system permease protein